MEPELTPEQEQAAAELIGAITLVFESMGRATEAGLDVTAVIGNHLRQSMGEEFNQLPIAMRMML